jgi:hypothetical protein
MPRKKVGSRVRTLPEMDVDPVRPAFRIVGIGIGFHQPDCPDERIVAGPNTVGAKADAPSSIPECCMKFLLFIRPRVITSSLENASRFQIICRQRVPGMHEQTLFLGAWIRFDKSWGRWMYSE